jgi:hypothetical protein
MKLANYFMRHLSAFILIILICIINSCSKDSTQTVSEPANENAKLIAEAKHYFENLYTGSNSTKSKTNNILKTTRQRLNKYIDWDKAYIGLLSSSKMVMVPLKYDSTLSITYHGNIWKLSNISRAFIYKDKNGNMRTEVVIRIPESYSMENAAKDTFSGLVLVEDWQGNAIKTIKFKNGKTNDMGLPVETTTYNSFDKKELLKYKTTNISCETYSWGHCGWNGSTGEFYGCWEDGSETVCTGGGDNTDDYCTCNNDYGGGGNPTTLPVPPPPPEGFRPLCKSSIRLTPSTGNTKEVNMTGIMFGITDMPHFPLYQTQTNVITFNLQITLPSSIQNPDNSSQNVNFTIAQQQQFIYEAYHFASETLNATHGQDFFSSAAAQVTYSLKFAEYVQYYLNFNALQGMFPNYENQNGVPRLGARANTQVDISKATPAIYTNGTSGQGC